MLPRCNGDVIAKCARAKNHATRARHLENNNGKDTWLEAQVFYVVDVRATQLKKE